MPPMGQVPLPTIDLNRCVHCGEPISSTNPTWHYKVCRVLHHDINDPQHTQGDTHMNTGKFSRSQVDHLRESLGVFDEMIYMVNRDNGWFDDDRRFGEDIALLHSEGSEMLEAYRDHGMEDVVEITHADGRTRVLAADDPDVAVAVSLGMKVKPVSVGSEAADVLIRLLDTCHRYGIDLAAETARKVTFNATRGYKHGGKAL